jgi:cell wall-associated NlpC family hydrolase
MKGEMLPIPALVTNINESWRGFATNVKNSGGDTSDVMKLISLQVAGVQMDLDAVSKDPYKIRVMFETYQANSQALSSTGGIFDKFFADQAAKARASVPSEQESQAAFNKRKDGMKKAQQDQLDSTKKHYDKLIAAEKKKEAELKKVQDAEKRRLDREKQLRDMQVGYNEAIASGSFGQAALIKNNMDAAKAGWSQEDKQRAEDEKQQSRLDKLEKARDKALEREQKRLDAINEMEYKANTSKVAAAKKAAEDQITAQQGVQTEIKKILEESNGDFTAAWAKIVANRDDWKAKGVDISSVLAQSITSQLPNIPKDVIKSVTSNLPNAPWEAIGKAIQAKIQGGPTGEKLLSEAMATLKAWEPKSNTTFTNGSNSSKVKSLPPVTAATGGYISGRGHGTSDEIDAKLSNGEFVMTNAAVNHYGKGLMDKINQRKFATGGYVESAAGGSLSRIFQGAAIAAIGNLAGRAPATGGNVSAGVDGGASGIAGGGGGSRVTGNGVAADIARMALNFVGVPYSYTGGSPEDGWGCAPFVHWLYAQRGYKIPGGSLSYNQYRGINEHPNRNQLSGGDLVFFKYANGVNTQNPINHVGMALNGSTMIHAANPKRGTVVSGIDWAHYVGAARPIGLDGKKNFARGGIAMMGKAGEFVVNDAAVQKYGTGFMNAINNQTYHGGGLITESGPRRAAGSAEAQHIFHIYGGNNNPQEIAEMVIQKINKKAKRVSSGR